MFGIQWLMKPDSHLLHLLHTNKLYNEKILLSFSDTAATHGKDDKDKLNLPVRLNPSTHVLISLKPQMLNNGNKSVYSLHSFHPVQAASDEH